MMADSNAALIAFIGVLAGGYVNNFLAEDYRRFRDGAALAGALAGELASHMAALPMLREMFVAMIAAIDRGEHPPFRYFDPPNDPVYESNVGKIGLLPSKAAEDTAFAYQQIRAFRVNFAIVLASHEQMNGDEIKRRLIGCVDAINRGDQRLQELIANLKLLAKQRYLDARTNRLRAMFSSIG
ncbi:hypothetical protein WI40_05255 [Burkholderia ubonensis]|nr:hypothetical protein WI31_11255 [Burkholderia ubonensis]KUZ25672.1 hypothetical protein WI29_08360 [Burkholderia ubonensis]KUZ26041.1 hypothetical protein WI30_25960 [Burkholderia ubonensis]KUZ27828.1 hypothetical protein WI32_27900 [Burkholderia ubonensis]KUZ57760.1 hypothetical protein WI33_03230 [Burkholderia ubonensis]